MNKPNTTPTTGPQSGEQHEGRGHEQGSRHARMLICPTCGSVEASDTSWRWNGEDWEHVCSNKSYALGHYVPDDLVTPAWLVGQLEEARASEERLRRINQAYSGVMLGTLDNLNELEDKCADNCFNFPYGHVKQYGDPIRAVLGMEEPPTVAQATVPETEGGRE